MCRVAMKHVVEVDDPPEYVPDDPDDQRVDEYLLAMELCEGDLVMSPTNTNKAGVMKVDSIYMGELNFHYPFVDHPQDSRYGGTGKYSQYVAEWYKSWLKGELVPANIDVEPKIEGGQ